MSKTLFAIYYFRFLNWGIGLRILKFTVIGLALNNVNGESWIGGDFWQRLASQLLCFELEPIEEGLVETIGDYREDFGELFTTMSLWSSLKHFKFSVLQFKFSVSSISSIFSVSRHWSRTS